MNLLPFVKQNKKGAALIIVLAFLVLLSGIVVAYLSRTTSDRQLSHGTFSENRADILARSALDVITGDLRQEILSGSTASTVNNYTIYLPTSNASMVPMRSGTPTPAATPPDPVANLIRRSYNSGGTPADPIPAPGVPSRASAVNSTSVSLNGRSVTTARWNRHYLIGRLNPASSAEDSTPVSTFTAPDWVLVTRNGPGPSPTPFATWECFLRRCNVNKQQLRCRTVRICHLRRGRVARCQRCGFSPCDSLACCHSGRTSANLCAKSTLHSRFLSDRI